MKKVLFISSTGGHLTELMQLKKLFRKYDYHIITEKTKVNKDLKKDYGKRINFVIYGTKDHKFSYIFKLFGSKIIFIETFANKNSKTVTGKYVYKFADLFLVQWEEMLKLYPNAKYWGSLF